MVLKMTDHQPPTTNHRSLTPPEGVVHTSKKKVVLIDAVVMVVVVLILTEVVLVENVMKRMVNTGAKTVLEIGGVLLELELPARGQEIRRDLIGRVTQAAEDDRMDHKVERESLGEVVVVT